jgi:diguanylate cyclase (GGDEF)-like protein/PAS domain S-box-containing protein
VHPDDFPSVAEQFADLVSGATTFIETETRVVCGDGETIWIGGGASLIRDPDGEPRYIQALIHDATARHLALDALAESEARYRALVETAPIGQVVCDLDGHLIQANRAYAELVGKPVEELIGQHLLERLHTDDLERLGDETVRLLNGETDSFDIEYRIVRPDGTTIWVRGPISLMHDESGAPTRIAALVQDIHERRESELRERQLSRIIESTSDLVGTIEPATGKFLYLNRAAREMFGLGERDVTTLDALSVYTEASARFWETDVAVTVEMGRTWIGELDMLNAAGEIIHVQQSVSPDLDERGHASQVSFVGRDVTQQRRREVELAHQATHDPLTGLPNRSLLLQLAEHALHQGDRNNSLVAILFMDLDRFKTVNDTLGHNIGDALLVEVAQRITGALRPSDTVARLGGDEFVVLCEDINDEHRAVAVAQRITAAIEHRPFTLGGASLSITTSVGIALSGNSEAHPESLLRDADAAMYRAKDRGRARHEIFDDEMRRRTTQRLELADELALAIERGQIVVYYQPIIDLVTGRVDGVEALCRWDHPTRGILGPGEFIGLAEETGLIVGLGLSATVPPRCTSTSRHAS